MSALKVKCPFCSAVLAVNYQPGIENKRLSCPLCKHSNVFGAFRPVTANQYQEDDSTRYPGTLGGDDAKLPDSMSKTADTRNLILGVLVRIPSLERYQLKHGRNVIGRRAQASKADIQMETGENRRISREHIVIEVKNIPVKGLVHYISLFKERVNKTFIGKEELLFGDAVILKSGDVIKLPDLDLRFEIPDDDATTIG